MKKIEQSPGTYFLHRYVLNRAWPFKAGFLLAIFAMTLGLFAQQAGAQHLKPGPVPVPLTPANEEQTVYPFPNFSWTKHPQAWQDVGKPVEYTIQISRTECFETSFDHVSRTPPLAFFFYGHLTGATTIGPRNILIEGNYFIDCPRPEIGLTWTRNAVIRNNRAELESGKLVPAMVSQSNSENIYVDAP